MNASHTGTQTRVETSAAELEAVCARLEDLNERLGALYIGGAANHRMANIRHLLLGEAFRVRMIVRELRGASGEGAGEPEFEDSILSGLMSD